MTHRRRLVVAAALLPACTLAVPVRARAQSRPQRRLALVIGNGRYAEASLPNPENDARLVATTLKNLGFEVDERYNLAARDFKRVLRTFAARLDDDLPLVFYYAGHGMQFNSSNYLLPVDLNLRDEGEVRDEAADLEDTLLARIDKRNQRPRVFIIDACRDNPFSTRSRVRTAPGLAQSGAAGALIAYSAGPGQTAEDGAAGGNSIFTRILAQEMMIEGIEAEVMMKSVRVKVQRETRGRQLPFLNSSMVVDFFFNPPRGGAPVRGDPSLALAGNAHRRLKLAVQAAPSLNTDVWEASASLALRLYMLRDDRAFSSASFDSLYDSDETTLGGAMMAVERLHLRPGETREIELALPPGARALGVFAAYREVERARWRSVLPLPADGQVPTVRLAAQARQVQLAWLR